jgi:5-methyltetrahydrofolate--homocysteine methyltransferase
MRNDVQEVFDSTQPILLDGAMGSMLIAAGLTPGSSPEVWNVEQPEQVRAVHRAYIQAGARLILTNSFGGNRFRLKRNNLQERVGELNRQAAIHARIEAQNSPHKVIVAGSMGPSGELLKPLGSLTFDEVKEAFAEQAAALAEGGVDLLWIETMSDLNEVRAAIEGARSVSQLPIAVTMTFDQRGRTMMGVKPEDMVKSLKGYDLIAIGANCGNGPSEIESAIQAMYAFDPTLRLIAKSNAGRPRLVEGKPVYDATPAVMAEHAVRVRALGAKLIGGCCGTTPEHIRAMAEALYQ